MPAKIKKIEIIERQLEVELDSKTICMTVKFDPFYKVWQVWLPSGKEFTIQQLIELSEVVYDAEFINEYDEYWLRVKGSEKVKILIQEKKDAANAVLCQFKISFPKERV